MRTTFRLSAWVLAGLVFTAVARSEGLLLVGEASRVVREYPLDKHLGNLVLESSRDTLQLSISGRNVALDVPRLLKIGGTELRETVFAFSGERPEDFFLLIPCGYKADRSGAAGSIIISIRNYQTTSIQSDSCYPAEARPAPDAP